MWGIYKTEVVFAAVAFEKQSNLINIGILYQNNHFIMQRVKYAKGSGSDITFPWYKLVHSLSAVFPVLFDMVFFSPNRT